MLFKDADEFIADFLDVHTRADNEQLTNLRLMINSYSSQLTPCTNIVNKIVKQSAIIYYVSQKSHKIYKSPAKAVKILTTKKDQNNKIFDVGAK